MNIRPSPWAGVDAFFRFLGGLVLVYATLAVPILATAAGPPGQALWLVFLDNLYLGYGLLVPLFPAVRLWFTRYDLDEEGVRVRARLMATTDQRVSWEKVTAVRERRTVLDRLFGIARIDIVAYGMRGTTVQLVGLRQWAPVRELVSARMRAHCSVTALQRGD